MNKLSLLYKRRRFDQFRASIISAQCIVFCIIIFISSSCKKKNPELIPDVSCEQFDEQPIFGYNLIRGFNYKSVDFNPNNKNEIILYSYDYHAGKGYLSVYNLENKENRIILEESLLSNARWSSKNWIVFTRTDYQLWKIKPNGDSLTQLTFQGRNFHPDWNQDGTKIVFVHQNPLSNIHIIDQEGNLDKNFELMGYKVVCWDNDNNNLGMGVTGGITFMDVSSSDVTSVVISPIPNNYGIGWKNDSTILWTTYDGLFQSNINGEEDIELLKGCFAREYGDLSVSPNKNSILFIRTDRNKIDPEIESTSPEVMESTKIILRKLDSGEEEIVLE